MIPAHVMQALGVLSRGDRVAEYADGRKEAVAITEPIIFDVMAATHSKKPSYSATKF